MRQMNMLVSGLVGTGEHKRICVYFSDKDKNAEGSIPDCKITVNNGFTNDEIAEIEEYLKENKDHIIEEARKVNPMKSFLGK
ncbi:MAG: hypothetical protein IK111_10365 [Lachnospiraceae bacterium]|nr:hypothetical protein [Lachnospiraceae bacterium]